VTPVPYAYRLPFLATRGARSPVDGDAQCIRDAACTYANRRLSCVNHLSGGHAGEIRLINHADALHRCYCCLIIYLPLANRGCAVFTALPAITAAVLAKALYAFRAEDGERHLAGEYRMNAGASSSRSIVDLIRVLSQA